MRSAPHLVVVDTDGGLDDALALLFLARHPAVRLLGVGSVHGNVPAPAAAANALRVLELAGDDHTPVALGADAPLKQDVHFRHPDDPLGHLVGPPTRQPAGESAAEQLVRLTRAHPGEVSVLALGPMTNLAHALDVDPDLPRLLRAVVAMGGVFTGPGNITEHAESNVHHDPDAAARICTAGFDLTLVGLDVTRQVTPTTSWLRALAADHSMPWAAYAQLLADTPREQRPPLPLHDPLAAAVLLEPALVTCRSGVVHVDTTQDNTRGRTRRDEEATAGPAARAAVTVDVPASLRLLLSGLLAGQ
ncbi:nucleoside hydrolase [Prauserella endophytica]|uniref:nucleoside hydrolase n=1 Tax=Prauserella endophytica TaxID=1592324 RepID=UPI00130527A9|nr:nucleoside hydrolase [Prauserella endophytica]